VQATILSLQHQSPIGWLLGWSAHAPVFVGICIALGELAVGVATVLGFWTRVAAVGGLLLALTFFLTVSFHTRPYYYGSDIVFVFAWSVPLLAGRWPDPSLDAWIASRARRDVDPRRRTLVLGASWAVVLAAATGVAAGLIAALGRAARPAARTTSLGGTPGPAAAPASTSAPTSSGQAPAAKGRAIAQASTLAPGQAVQFKDNQGQPAWLIHETSGAFRAFSAVCTHAGCIVGVDGGQFICPCHGGAYSLSTGAVLGGPPPSGLAPIPVPRLGRRRPPGLSRPARVAGLCVRRSRRSPGIGGSPSRRRR
jgi:thiosulfate dehydrogenase [quinone] large subunit